MGSDRLLIDWKTIALIAVIVGTAVFLILNISAPPFPNLHRHHTDWGPPAVHQAVKVKPAGN